MNKKSIAVSIIICTYNRSGQLRETLEAISRMNVITNTPTELIIVDNGSTDSTQKIASSFHPTNIVSHYLKETRQGQCFARNAGLAAAKGDIILFTDDDVRPPVDWLTKMCTPIITGQADAVQGGIKMASHLQRGWMNENHKGMLFDIVAISEEQRLNPFLIGANMGFSRSVLDCVPGFDVELGPGAIGYGDETLFCEQLKQAGCRILFVPDAVVEHHFDPKRLLRSEFLAAARKHGRTGAYLVYHWSHDPITFPVLRLVKNWLKLALYRIARPAEWRREEGIADWEYTHTLRAAFYASYLKLRTHPRKYETRALIKSK